MEEVREVQLVAWQQAEAGLVVLQIQQMDPQRQQVAPVVEEPAVAFHAYQLAAYPWEALAAEEEPEADHTYPWQAVVVAEAVDPSLVAGVEAERYS